MMIWLGVVGTVLCVVGMGVLYQLYIWNNQFAHGANLIVTAADRIANSTSLIFSAAERVGQDIERIFGKKLADENDRAAEALGKVLRESVKDFAAQSERSLADWKLASAAFAKSESELADNLGMLLREIKISKQFAAGSIALVEKNFFAIDRLLNVVEAIKSGPRIPMKIAPTDADAAAAEAGETDEQQRAIEAMLANARDRVMGEDGLM